MTRFLDDFFGTAGLVPLGAAMQWRPDLVTLHAVSDGLIAWRTWGSRRRSGCSCRGAGI